MADNFFPGFEDDEPKKTPAKPEPPPAPAKAFDPFADVKAQSAPAAAPAQPAPAAGPKPAAPAAKPPPPPAPLDEDKDIKPGSAKDLWKCPHCGAGNKPGRPECRVCGKKPSDPVVVPWNKNPVILAGIAVGIIGLIVALVFLMQADLSLHEPGTADRKPRIGGSAEGRVELSGGIVLELKRRVAVSGRIAGIGTGPGKTTTIALALGPSAAGDLPEAERGDDGVLTVPGGCGLVCIFASKPDLKPGQWLSLVGDTGELVQDGTLLARDQLAVRVESFKAQ